LRDTTLVVLARAPEPGRVKTRLAQVIGVDATLRVHQQLLALTAAVARQWAGPVLLVSTGDASMFRGTDCEGFLRCDQSEGSLGDRLAAAVRAGLQLASRALIIGTDCPSLQTRHLKCLVEALATCDCAIGPATDGGFWGLATGSARAADVLATPSLPWSEARTLARVRHELHACGFSTRLGPTLSDLDTKADLDAAVASGLIDLDGRAWFQAT
jgi:hypothetical protein